MSRKGFCAVALMAVAGVGVGSVIASSPTSGPNWVTPQSAGGAVVVGQFAGRSPTPTGATLLSEPTRAARPTATAAAVSSDAGTGSTLAPWDATVPRTAPAPSPTKPLSPASATALTVVPVPVVSAVAQGWSPAIPQPSEAASPPPAKTPVSPPTKQPPAPVVRPDLLGPIAPVAKALRSANEIVER